MQREAFSVLGLFDLFVLWNVWYNATDNHSGGSRPANQVSHSKAQFIVNDPVHCDILKLFSKCEVIGESLFPIKPPLGTSYAQSLLLLLQKSHN